MATTSKFASKQVAGKIRCDTTEFGEDPVKGSKKSCYCKHENPSFLDEEIQFNMKLDLSHAETVKKVSRGKDGITLALKNADVHFNRYKHDKLADRGQCKVNMEIKELPLDDKKHNRLSFELKQSPSAIRSDGSACWPGLFLKGDLIHVSNKESAEADHKFMSNAAKLSAIIPPELFSESFIGHWQTKGRVYDSAKINDFLSIATYDTH